jgi:hypothetical protein
MSLDPISSEALAEFAEAFSLLESAAVRYPVTHHRSREAGAGVLGAMALLSDASGVLSVEVATEGLRLGSTLVALSTSSLQALHTGLQNLGVLRLEIDARATHEHLYQLVSSMRSLGERIQTQLEPEGIAPAELPATIRICSKPRDASIVAAEIGPKAPEPSIDSMVDLACAPLLSPGVETGTRDACRGWVQNSMRRIAERVDSEPRDFAGTLSDSPQRPLDDVLLLAARTMQHALKEFISRSAGQNDLTQMFKTLELATGVCDDPESAGLMVDVLHDSAREVVKGPGVSLGREDDSRSADDYRLSVGELHRQLTLLKPALGQMANLEGDGRSESFSIAFGAVIQPASDASLQRVVAKLPALLQPPWTLHEEHTLIEAIRSLCASGSERAVDRALPVLSTCLVGDSHEMWLGLAVECAQMGTHERLAILWPHLANEVLLGPRSNSEVALSNALAQLARLHSPCLPSAVTRLAELTAVKGGRISPYAFTGDHGALMPLYAALLELPCGESVGELLLARLKAQPPPWEGAVVFQTFEHCDANCRELLSSVLRGGSLNQVERPVQLEASRLIAQCILSLPLERAGEEWVPPALKALGSLRTPDSERALRRILGERKHMIMPLWPAECRAAAQHAVSKLERSGFAPKD